MSAAVWPCLILGLVALGLAGSRVYVLAWQAPVAAAPLTAALVQQIARGDLARAQTLCRSLEPRWAAECADECLRASQEHAPLPGVIEEQRVAYAQRAQSGIAALRTLGRMAFPLALGTAIVSMSGAFGAADVARVEQALSTALQCLTMGLLSAVFCRVSAAALWRQGQARMREISAVCRGLLPALADVARVIPTQS